MLLTHLGLTVALFAPAETIVPLERISDEHGLFGRAIEEAEAEREEGGARWVAQGLSELAQNWGLREQSSLDDGQWLRVRASLRAQAALDCAAAHAIHGALYQLRALESLEGVAVDEIDLVWARTSALIEKPKSRDRDGRDRVAHFFREYTAFARRTQPDVDPRAKVVAAARAAGCKVRFDARDLDRWMAEAEQPVDEDDEVEGIRARFWTGAQEDFDRLVRGKRTQHDEVFRYSTRDEGQLYWELGGGERPQSLHGPSVVGRLDGTLSLPAGAYRVHVKCDDAVRFVMNGSTLVDTWEHTTPEAGHHWGRWFSRDVWLDERNPVVIDVWDGGNLFNLTVRIDKQRPNGAWMRVPFELSHSNGR